MAIELLSILLTADKDKKFTVLIFDRETQAGAKIR
jgi:hypothetical protein